MIITKEEVKAFLKITTTDFDTQIDSLILKYQSFIKNYCWIIESQAITEKLTFQNVFYDSFWVKFWLKNNVLSIEKIQEIAPLVVDTDIFLNKNKVIYNKSLDTSKPYLIIEYTAWYSSYDDLKQIILTEVSLELSNIPNITTSTSIPNNWTKAYKEWPLEIQYFSNKDKYWQRLENDFITNYKSILEKYKILVYRQ